MDTGSFLFLTAMSSQSQSQVPQRKTCLSPEVNRLLGTTSHTTLNRIMASSNEVTFNSNYGWEDSKTGFNSGFLTILICPGDSYLTMLSSLKPDEEESVTELAAELKTLSLMAMEGDQDSFVLILYDTEAAGEQEQTPRKSQTQVCKEHLEKLVQAADTAWSQTGPELDQRLSPC